VHETAAVTEGVVVGSAIVNKIAEGSDASKSCQQICDDVHGFVTELASGLGRD
jgi:tryptophan synthase alpha subunit